ncbi:Solute carrier family 35 member F6 [Strongyloides ratti]|uniref:Solute carrier family 35 member F6 n=1 Tax=Strongyloides ratti TaxID=34506 RepID=A0A090KVU5_STRRB|nr:Solute carrier family 35 member F6 [Strongyloides ratti]CEF59377.1 Solute carrier family 35 member F6 [Strongyloides ratti]
MDSNSEMATTTNNNNIAFKITISILMVVTGSLNTIAAKWADSLKSDGRNFNHPFFQAACMFLGELSCLGVYYILKFSRKRRNQDLENVETTTVSPFIFLPPAFCDVFATSIMYVGLNLTTASSFQMLRGAVIIFTGLLSVAFLGARLRPYKWLGMSIVCLGLVIVGVVSIVYEDNPEVDINAMITGDILIVTAQIIVAVQMVYEQKYLTQYDVHALYAVGYEGLFGLSILGFLIPMFYFIHVPKTFSPDPEHRLENILLALKEIRDNPIILLPLGLTVISIALFNFAGISVTKTLSATTRMVLDSVRTLIIWVCSIPLFGEEFIPLQIVGFIFLILGMFTYNDILVGPYVRSKVLPMMNESSAVTIFCGNFWRSSDSANDSDRENLVNSENEE